MIELNIHEYCQSCPEFEPRIAQRPTQFINLTGDIGSVFGDTIIECENRRHCEALYNHLKRSDNNA